MTIPVATIAYLLLTAMPVMPLLNLAARPTFVRTFPRVGLAFGFFLILYAASLAALVWQFPRSLPWIAAVAGAGSIALWWRSRGAYGKNQRLPPGSLALLPLGPWIDHWHYAKLSRVYGPIFKTSHFFHPMVCLTNLESALRLLKEHDDVRLRSPKVAADRFLPCGFLRGMDPEAHKTYRRVVQALITPQVLATWEATISADISAALAKLAAFPGGVHAKPVWEQLILRSFSRLFFGISPETEAFQQLEAALQTLALVSNRRISVPWLPSERKTERVLEQLCALLRHQSAPGCLLAELRAHPEFTDSEQVLRLLAFTLYLGASDMAGLLQWALKNICDYPGEVRRLRSEWEQGLDQTGSTSFSRRFTLETIRRNQVEHLYRRVLADIEWEGVRIPKGWLLRICLAEAHRDAAVFPNPSHFTPDRFLNDPPTQSEFLPFGAFRRSCLGDGVTHAFLRQFLGTLVRDWDCRQIGESHEDYHAWHWTPGSDFRVILTPR